ncbi:hypothetical protein AMTRI_Chr06g199530 [Amborella trichopoda]
MKNGEERNMLTLQEFRELLRKIEENYEELIRVLGLNTWTEEKEEIALESNDEEEEIAGESNEVCTICLNKTEVENVKVLQCSHTFHSRCIGIWVARKSSCPLCRCAI